LNSRKTNYRPDIDGLRAFSVLSVLIFHASPKLLHGGFVGVDIFFVISGYLISSIIFGRCEEGTFDVLQFYGKRIRRIFPALILVLASTLLVGFYDSSAPNFTTIGKHVAAAGTFLSNFALWKEIGYFDQSSNVKPLLHLWALSVEEQFYILWPFILMAGYKAKNVKRTIYSILAFVFLSSLAFNIFMVNKGDASSAFFLPHTRFWELMVGSGLAYFEMVKKIGSEKQSAQSFGETISINAYLLRQPIKQISSLVGAALLIISILMINKGPSFPGWMAILPTFGAALIIYAGREALVNRYILANKYVVAIGLISYPLYLWHWPFIVFPRIDGFNNIVRFILIAISFLMAWLTYKFVEKPIRFGNNKNLQHYAPWVLIAMLFSVVSFGLNIQSNNGYPDRFPKYINQALSYDRTFDLKTWRLGKCFLLAPSENETKFDPSCVDANFARSDAIFLWGDSVMASMYPGFAYMQGIKKFPLSQFTSTNCPPFLNYDDLNNLHCHQLNMDISSHINRLSPKTVIISAYWLKFYKDYDVDQHLEETVIFLRSAGVKKIIVIDPLPLWTPTILTSTFMQYKMRNTYPLPKYTSLGLSNESQALDKRLRAKTTALGVIYLSALDVLCKDSACLSRVGDSYEDISSFDTMHLSVPAAKFLVSSFFSTPF